MDKGHTYLNINHIDSAIETLNHEIAHHNGLGEVSATAMGKISDFAYNIGTSLNQEDINTHRQAITPTAQTLQSLSTDEQLVITQDNQALLNANEVQRVEGMESGDGVWDYDGDWRGKSNAQLAKETSEFMSDEEALIIKDLIGFVVMPIGFADAYHNAKTDEEKALAVATAFKIHIGKARTYVQKAKTQPKQSATTQTKATQPKPATKCSFHGSTLISTANGYKPISAIKIGDFVWSRDEYTGKYSYQPVTNWYHNQYQETVHVTIVDSQGNEQILISNAIHPFFAKVPYDTIAPVSSEGHDYQGEIDNGVWIDASNLQSGFQLLSEDGTWQTVKSVSIAKEALTAYNLTVDNTHTYFVSAQGGKYGVWVHNDCFDRINFNLNRLPLNLRHAANDTISHINKGTKPSWLTPDRRRKWGSEYKNRSGDLPRTTSNGTRITYKEYDIQNTRGTNNAGIDRIVVGSDGRMYYTGTHYGDNGGKPFGRIK